MYTVLTTTARLSAMTIFLNKPHSTGKIPTLMFSNWKGWRSFSWWIMLLERSIGPATNWGKKEMNKA